MASFGLPVYLENLSGNELTVKLFGNAADAVIPAGSELLALKCIQMYVRPEENLFVWRELTADGKKWEEAVIQEEGILDIHMELDHSTKIFTLSVLASGGKNSKGDTPCPSSWLKEYWQEEYSNHVVWLARRAWKVNNLQ